MSTEERIAWEGARKEEKELELAAWSGAQSAPKDSFLVLCMSAPDFSLLEIICTQADPTAARVRVRLPLPNAAQSNWRLTGKITGPDCDFSRTLPLQVSLVPSAAVEGLIADAYLPEPCFWTPALPFLYQVEVELRSAEEAGDSNIVLKTERPWGILPLATRKKQLLLEGHNWVLRGVMASAVETPGIAVEPSEIDAWREEGAAMLVTDPNDVLCEKASRRGVMFVAEVGDQAKGLPAILRRLAKWPAVGMIVVPDSPEAAGQATSQATSLRRFTPGKLLVQQLDADKPAAPAPWASAFLCRGSDAESIAHFAANCALPIIAMRAISNQMTLSAARAACDELQRDLAGRGVFAGYCVG